MSTIETFTGKQFDFRAPMGQQICLEDIAEGLSNQIRTTQGLFGKYTVIDHCLNGVRFLQVSSLYVRFDIPWRQNFVKAFLLHDASEAYMTDLPSPLKELLPQYHEIEQRVMTAIYAKYGIIDDTLTRQSVKVIDKRLLVTEKKVLGRNSTVWDLEHRFMPLDVELKISSDPKADFLSMCEKLGIKD